MKTDIKLYALGPPFIHQGVLHGLQYFPNKLLNLENLSLANNDIASLMDTIARHVIAVPEITSSFTITIPPPPPFFNPLPQQATPTPTPITSEATTSFHLLPDFSSVFKFNDIVINLEKTSR
ncbi:hypothetical protein Tco_1439366 [Tanacetum coccineum]